MSKDAGEDLPRDEASADVSTPEVQGDPLAMAASRGDDPLGMFAIDTDKPEEQATAPTTGQDQGAAGGEVPEEEAPSAMGGATTAAEPLTAHQPSLPDEPQAQSIPPTDTALSYEPLEAPDRSDRTAVAAATEPVAPPGLTERSQLRAPVPREPRVATDLRGLVMPGRAGERREPDAAGPELADAARVPRVEPHPAQSAETDRSAPDEPGRAERREPPFKQADVRAAVPAGVGTRPLMRATAGPAGQAPDGARTSAPRRPDLPVSPTPARRGLKSVPVLIVSAIVVVSGLGFGGWRLYRTFGRQPVAAAVQQEGKLTVDSRPNGAPVEIDGVARGATPLVLKVKAGKHLLRVGGPAGREIDVVVAAGGDVSHHIELPEVRTRLHVATVPSAATVRVDGQTRGAAPLDLDDLTPGPHTVVVEAGGVTVRREVDLRSGAENSVVISLGSGGPTTGYVTVTAPFDVDVYEGARLMGRSRDGQMLMVSGTHDLTLTNDALGYKEASRVNVTAGATATIRVSPRNGQLSVNALPWAEVLLDGNSIGQTPIANYAVPIGQHELTLRNPNFPEFRQTILVTLTAPTRVGHPFTK